MTATNINILVDGVTAIGVHNGVARIQFMHLGADNKPVPCVELNVPLPALKSVIEALRKIDTKG